MKRIILILLAMVALLSEQDVAAQVINWKSLERRPAWSAGGFAGIEHGLAGGVHINRKIPFRLPLLITATGSLPAGKEPFDDYKIKTGVQFRWLKLESVHFSSRLEGLFRRYENTYARLLNFGTDLATTVGYYRSSWFAAGQLGFDKAIVTHFRHTEAYKSNYPDVVDGWYEPSTGGNFYYGLQAGRSWKAVDIFLDLRRVVEQDFTTQPAIPFIGSVGLTFWLGAK